MNGQNIVCFAKDWSEDPTSNNHVMRLLAEKNEVLWLNSIAMRTPSLRSGSDLKKIGTKLKRFAKGAETVTERMRVFTPIVLPLPHSPWAAQINQHILKASITLLRHQRRMTPFQLWTFLPPSVKYVGKLGEELVVYYCTDEWSHFSYLDGKKMEAMERELCEKADVVFVTANTLLERKRPYNPETHLIRHGVDHAHFASALDDATPLAPELAALPAGQPVIGFIGLIQEWVDLETIAFVAASRPSWQFVLVGRAAVDVSAVAKYPNVHLLGRRPYADLPRYCKGFSVGTIPFAVNELTVNVNPIKLREYLSAGLPVVSSKIPEVASYANDRDCFVPRTKEEFLQALEKAMAVDSPAARRKRSDAMRAESWQHKVDEIGAHIDRVKQQRR